MYAITLPASRPQEAETITFGRASSMRALSSPGAKPPNTTECTAPIRAQASIAIAASANLPTIIYSLFWRKFTTRGAVWSMYGGLAAAVILIVLSPVFWGTETSVFKNVGTAIWPLNNPGIVSIPLGFFLGWLGSVTSTRRESREKAAEMDVRSLTGYGAEKAVDH